MAEMTSADTARYKTSILAFINAMLHGFDSLVERCRLREQLLAGQLLTLRSLHFRSDIVFSIGYLIGCHLPSSPVYRRHLSNDDCLEDKRENQQNRSVLCCVYDSCTQ